ncbi:MAG: hypothetical protein OEV55_05290 [candidate division Zixibacteria bacterium]|nr:hypothetical protein [candidate division Zixibacteria bacterium]
MNLNKKQKAIKFLPTALYGRLQPSKLKTYLRNVSGGKVSTTFS